MAKSGPKVGKNLPETSQPPLATPDVDASKHVQDVALETIRAAKNVDPLDAAKALARQAFEMVPNLAYIKYDFVDDGGEYPWVKLGFLLSDDDLDNGVEDQVMIGDYKDAPDGFPDLNEIGPDLREAYADGQEGVMITRQDVLGEGADPEPWSNPKTMVVASHALVDIANRKVLKLTAQESRNDAVWEFGPSISDKPGIEVRDLPIAVWSIESATNHLFGMRSIQREDVRFLTNWLGEDWDDEVTAMNIPEAVHKLIGYEQNVYLGDTFPFGHIVDVARPRLALVDGKIHACMDVEAFPRLENDEDTKHIPHTKHEMKLMMDELHAAIMTRKDSTATVYTPFWADDQKWNLGVLIPLDEVKTREDLVKRTKFLFTGN
jgi:hypothetical protein